MRGLGQTIQVGDWTQSTLWNLPGSYVPPSDSGTPAAADAQGVNPLWIVGGILLVVLLVARR